MADEELQKFHQDQLDSFFTERIVGVRNALRELGWSAPEGVLLMQKEVPGYGRHGVIQDVKTVGAGRNVVGATWSIDGGTSAIADDLTKTVAELAAAIDAAAQPAIPDEPAVTTWGRQIAEAFNNEGPEASTALRAKIIADNGLKIGEAAALSSEVEKFIDKVKLARYKGEKAGELGEESISGRTPPANMSDDEKAAWLEGYDAKAPAAATAGNEPEPEVQTSPTDAELEAAAESGAQMSYYTRNLADPSTRDMIPLANLYLGDEVLIRLWTKNDVERAKAAVAVASQQSAYTPFDWSQVKMPTAVQLGLNTMKSLVLTHENPNLYDKPGESGLQPGWSNGNLLDLTQRPKFIEKAIKDYFVDMTSAGIRHVPTTAVDKIVSGAKSAANTLVEPIANYDAQFADTSSTEAIKKGKKIPVNAFVLANKETGLVVNVDKRYFSYFAKTYKGAEFYAQDASSALLVKHQGKVVGVVMPVRGADANTLKRAMKAASADPQAGYAKAKADVDAAYARSDAADAVMKQFPKGSMGLTPDDVKATSEWQAAYAESNAALAEIQKANKYMLDNFPKEVRAERDAKRKAQEEALAAEPAAELTPVERVNAAYSFANATDEFKEWLGTSSEDSAYPEQAYQLTQPYSPLNSAAAMEEEAKKHGATIEWGFFGGTPA